MKRLVLLWAATSALAGFAAGGDLSVGAADVQEVFENPPAKAHTGVWWHWMGSQVTEAGIVADLDYFRRVGISSATIFGMTDVCTPWAKAIPGSPHDGLLPFSDAWWKLVKFACVEAGKRGIELGIHNCPGYTSTGGPWIPPALAMRELVFNVTNVEAQISLEPHAPYPIYLEDKGRYGLPDVPARRSDFREIAVVRGVRVGHVPMGSFTQPNPQAVFGLECDKMNPEAVAFHLDHVIGEMKRHLGDELGKSLTFVLLDSYEAGRPTWTPHLREEFLKRRGYDPLDYLPVLGGYTNLYTAAEVVRFRRDFDRTVADLYRDVLFKMMRDKLHAVGLEFACEPYEGPFVPRECAAYVDRLMTEFWFRPPERTDDYSPIPDGWNRWLRADGVRHNVIEAEAFTGQPSDCRWNETMAAIKACGDQHYLRGVNRFTLHSNPHQPWGDDVLPGVAMGRWGTHFGRNQVWANESKALFDYQARCQALLQWGEPTDERLALPAPLRTIGREQGMKTSVRKIFFVVNDSDRTVDLPATGGEWFDPVDGAVGAPPETLAARQSGFLVFRGRPAPAPKRAARQVLAVAGGPWTVTFGEKTVTWPTLVDWTASDDPAIRYFSGTAVYRTSFDAPHANGTAAELDVGDVNGQSVRVVLNGRDLGVVWCAPSRLSVPAGLLRDRNNELELRHANVWANRLIGDEQEPPDCDFEPAPLPGGWLLSRYPAWFKQGLKARTSPKRTCFATWNYFTKDSPLVPSGVLGPVRVLAAFDGHEVRLDHAVPRAAEGLLLGNGDLSASVGVVGEKFVVRFGKGDVWDRRLDLTDMPKPVSVREYIDGVLKEGWTCWSSGYGAKALNGTKDEKRMKEACGGAGHVAGRYPYPCPKPVGELQMRFPLDIPGGMKVDEVLQVERGLVLTRLSWTNGVAIDVACAIHPTENRFALRWNVSGWGEATRFGVKAAGPVGFGLTRWRDPDPVRHQLNVMAAAGQGIPGNRWYKSWEKATALPPPKTVGGNAVQQDFPPDGLFPDGFKCRMTLRADRKRMRVWAADLEGRQADDAWVVAQPNADVLSGELEVLVTTSRDGSLEPPKPLSFAGTAKTAADAARAYWAKSALRIPGDRRLEDFWYATYHARRCVLRGGTVPPGLFLPSTIGDFPNWHGDYHSNYNMQSTYWGDFTADRLEQAEAYFDMIDFFRPIGRKIAKDYYGCRGCFIPLQAYPIAAEEDCGGTVPLGRMVYMSGWAMTRYMEYYRYTLDKAWLAKRGYPFIRECALFYLDFLKKAPHPDLPPELDDGKYHAFPSIQSEGPLTGKAADVCDRPQVLSFIRHSLAAAVEASTVLGVDADLRAQWTDRLENIVGYRSDLKGYERHCYLVCPPENVYAGHGVPFKEPKRLTPEELAKLGVPEADRDRRYAGATLRWRSGFARNPGFVYERDYVAYRRMLSNWMHPNGLLWAMSLDSYGKDGGWTESLSCMAPLQEMLLTSWDGAIRLFPLWRKTDDVAFSRWRAQGAFLVSAELKGGRVARFEVKSEKGADCLMHGDWAVADAAGNAVATDRDAFGRLRFKTVAGGTYRLGEAKR